MAAAHNTGYRDRHCSKRISDLSVNSCFFHSTHLFHWYRLIIALKTLRSYLYVFCFNFTLGSKLGKRSCIYCKPWRLRFIAFTQSFDSFSMLGMGGVYPSHIQLLCVMLLGFLKTKVTLAYKINRS